MDIYLIMGWESNCGNWQVLNIVFTPKAVEENIEFYKTNCPEYNPIKVETWYRNEDEDEDEATFYSDDTIYHSEDE